MGVCDSLRNDRYRLVAFVVFCFEIKFVNYVVDDVSFEMFPFCFQ